MSLLNQTNVKQLQYQEFHMPCPPGSTGEGYTMWVLRDDSGNVIATGSYGDGCENTPVV